MPTEDFQIGTVRAAALLSQVVQAGIDVAQTVPVPANLVFEAVELRRGAIELPM